MFITNICRFIFMCEPLVLLILSQKVKTMFDTFSVQISLSTALRLFPPALLQPFYTNTKTPICLF